ncbi:MAG: peptidoglycan-binding protein [Deltaproteobacteria bacterium]|nr:peptidoglycan-binding protein [Deltaproteobacteria bacterium]
MQQQGKEPGDHKGTEPWGPGARGDAEQQAGREDIRRAQEALKAKGLDPGPANGMMGPETEAALKVFQQREGLPVTGRLDDKTKQALGLGTGATRGKGGASPSQGPRGDTQ